MQASNAPSLNAIFAIAWPLALKAVMLHGIVVIDAYLVSSLGEEALAAIGLAGAIVGLLFGIIFSFSTATQIRSAQSFGGSGDLGLKTAFYCGLFINLVSISIGIILVVLFGQTLIASFAQTPWIADQATVYLQIFLLVAFSESISQCLGSHFNGCGRTRLTFYSYLIAMPLNILVSIILINGLWGAPTLGIAGAAWGSAIGTVARLLFLGFQFERHHAMFRHVAGWRGHNFRASLRRHFTFSLPIAGTFLSMTIGNQACVLIYTGMSVNAFAAMTLITPWVQVAGTFGMGWAQATGIIVAQLLGGKATTQTLDRFLSRAWRAAFIAALIVAFVYLCIILASPWLYASLESETRAALWLFLPTLLILPFPKGSNAICGQTLRASGDTLYVMHIFNAGQWLCKVPLTFLLVVIMDAHVAWVFAAFLAEELFKFPLFHRRLFKGDWKRANVSEN